MNSGTKILWQKKSKFAVGGSGSTVHLVASPPGDYVGAKILHFRAEDALLFRFFAVWSSVETSKISADPPTLFLCFGDFEVVVTKNRR